MMPKAGRAQVQRKMLRLIFFILVSCLVASPVRVTSVSADQVMQAMPVGQVVKLRGPAEITRKNATLPLLLGTALVPGDEVKTGPGGRLKVAFSDGSSVALGENARLRIENFAVSAPQTRDALLALGQGTLHAIAAKAGPGSRFEIRTSLAFSAVRGTEWFVFADPAETDVAVINGRVGVGLARISAESAVSIGRDTKIVVTPGGGLGNPRLLTKAEIGRLLLATDAPGGELPFDLSTAPKLEFPLAQPADRGAAEPSSPGGAQKRRVCLISGLIDCNDRGNDHDRGGSDRGKGSDHHKSDHDSGGGSSN
jgi:hypothetical protein